MEQTDYINKRIQLDKKEVIEMLEKYLETDLSDYNEVTLTEMVSLDRFVFHLKYEED